jgi:quercetin dioxygenase-like cupin family protein
MSVPEGRPDLRKDLFGGRGAVRVWDLLAQRRAAPFTAALWCELEPGGSVGRHVQEHYPEIVIGLEGSGEAAVDGQWQSLEPGDLVHLPLGSVLELRNRLDDQALRYLIIKARGPG